MNQIYEQFKKHVGLLACVAALASASTASAAVPFPAGGDLEANVEYSLSTPDVVAKYVPTKTGEITYICGNAVVPYTSEEIVEDNEIKNRIFQNYADYGTYALEVEAGVAVYFHVIEDYSFSVGSDAVFKINAGLPIEIVSYSEPEGSVLSLTNGFSEMTVTFNQPVEAKDAYIFAKGQFRPMKLEEGLSMQLNLKYVEPLMGLFESGILEGGEDVAIYVSDITNASGEKYNDGNPLALNYKAPSKPVKIEELIVPEVFDGNWSKGDPNAIVTATYSGNISRAQYTLRYGLDPSASMPSYYEEVGDSDDPTSKSPVTIEGNKVTIDFSTAKRNPVDMGYDSNEIALKVTAWDESGQPVIGEGQGSFGGKEVMLPFIYHQVANFQPVYTPASGTSLHGVKELKLQYQNYTDIEFTGIDFIITEGEIINVPVSETTHQELGDQNWSVEYIIPVPEAVQTATTNVRVKLTGATSLTIIDEGLADEFDAIYFPREFETTDDYTVTPAAGEVEQLLEFEVGLDGYQVAIVGDGTAQIILSVAKNGHTQDIGWFGIEDVTAEQGVAKFSLQEAITEEGSYTLTIPEGFFCFNSNSAESLLNGPKEVEYNIAGTTEPPVELPVNSSYYVTPEEGDVDNLLSFEIGCQNFETSITASQNQEIVLNRVENSESTLVESFSKESIDIVNGVATFSLSGSVAVTGYYELLIPEGFFTFTNESLDSKMINSGKVITYRITAGDKNLEYEATPAPGIVKSLGEISLYFPYGASVGEGNAQLLIDDNDPINLEGELSWPEDWSDPSATLKFTLPQEYTENGKYVLLLPDGYIHDANGKSTGEYRLEYTLDKATGVIVPVDSDSTYDVYSIDGVKLIDRGSRDSLNKLPRGLYIINGKKVTI